MATPTNSDVRRITIGHGFSTCAEIDYADVIAGPAVLDRASDAGRQPKT